MQTTGTTNKDISIKVPEKDIIYEDEDDLCFSS